MDRKKNIMIVSKRLIIFAAASLVVTGAMFAITFFGLSNRFMVSWFSFQCGIIGGFVSIQQRMKKIGDEELNLLSESWTAILLVPIYGGIFSLVLYMIFLSGLVENDLFPQFDIKPFSDPTTTGDLQNFFRGTYPKQPSDFAKLAVWSFIAGFSERFVPQIIQKVTPNE